MIEFYPYPLLVGFTGLVAVLVRLWRQGRSLMYLFFTFLFATYLLAAISLVFFPVPLPLNWAQGMTIENTLDILLRVNLVPFDLDMGDSNS